MTDAFDCACADVKEPCHVAGASRLKPNAQRALLADASARIWPHITEWLTAASAAGHRMERLLAAARARGGNGGGGS